MKGNLSWRFNGIPPILGLLKIILLNYLCRFENGIFLGNYLECCNSASNRSEFMFSGKHFSPIWQRSSRISRNNTEKERRGETQLYVSPKFNRFLFIYCFQFTWNELDFYFISISNDSNLILFVRGHIKQFGDFFLNGMPCTDALSMTMYLKPVSFPHFSTNWKKDKTLRKWKTLESKHVFFFCNVKLFSY
jgi:hypothetical protein